MEIQTGDTVEKGDSLAQLAPPIPIQKRTKSLKNTLTQGEEKLSEIRDEIEKKAGQPLLDELSTCWTHFLSRIDAGKACRFFRFG